MCVNPRTYKWPVGETVNTSASQADTHGFEPRTGHHNNSVVKIKTIEHINGGLYIITGFNLTF